MHLEVDVHELEIEAGFLFLLPRRVFHFTVPAYYLYLCHISELGMEYFLDRHIADYYFSQSCIRDWSNDKQRILDKFLLETLLLY